MKPMLARTLGPKFNDFPCFVQPKLNGVRALYQQPCKSSYGIWQSRDEKVWLDAVLRHLSDELEPLYDTLGPVILDGELYVHGWRLQRINAAVAVNRKEPTEDTPHVCFHVFDIVDPTKRFSDRWFPFYHLLQEAELPHIKAVPTSMCVLREELDCHFHLYTREGYEGVMLRTNEVYEFGEHMARHGQNMTTFRSKFLWKHKQWEDDEFECLATTLGEGKADIGIGALILATKTYMPKETVDYHGGPVRSFKVGTGLTDEDRVAFAANPPIGKLIKVRYLCLTADGIPFNPSFLCVVE